uniref:Uncharacterized protein n=1 Tax=Caudovirales sp. ctTVN2 TaxID=2827634 RepID=A0A8S5S8Y7_9CAUD|nr:MAG TPA: hypothetical protein [Caudovirales sp. ctTVN2]DAW26994.1 MAG TPA: hypothetical protein [Caudoviricetes sp.]
MQKERYFLGRKALKLLFDMLTRTLLAWQGTHLTLFHVSA